MEGGRRSVLVLLVLLVAFPAEPCTLLVQVQAGKKHNGGKSKKKKMPAPYYTSMTPKAVRTKAAKLDLSSSSKDLADAIQAAGLCDKDGVINGDNARPSSSAAALEEIASICGASPDEIQDMFSALGDTQSS